MRYFFRVLVVCSLIVLMSADAGMACRWFHARQPVWYSYAPVAWCGPYVEPSAGWQPCGEPVAGGLPVESSTEPATAASEPAESVLTLPAPADDSPPPEETTVESPVPDQPAEPPPVPEVVEPLAVPTPEANSTEQVETKAEQPEPSEAADEAKAPEAEAAVSEKAEPAQGAAEAPAEAEQVEDLLDDTKPAATGETEETESEAEAEAEGKAEDEAEAEDLFSEPSGDADKPAGKEPAEKAESEDDLDSLFNDTGRGKADVQVSAGRAHQTMRRWVDNTGNYTCRGRLLQVLPGEVRVLKTNGRTTTVPMRRLSQADRQFVAGARRGLPPARLLAQATAEDEG